MKSKKLLRFISCSLATFMTISSIPGTAIGGLKEVQAVEKEESYTQYVDPFVSTEVDYGQLFPGSVVPNGLVKLSPDTYPHNTLDHAGYDYKKLQIQGFSHTRIEGVGGQGAGGDVLVTPTYVEYTERPNAVTRAMKYTKDVESAKPGYYSVELTPNTGKDNDVKSDTEMGRIKAELTTDQRTGYHRYTFPKAGNVNILADLNYTYHGTDIRDAILDVIEESETTTALSGRFSGRNVGGSGKYTMYFYMETSKPANNVKTWNGKKLSDEKSQKGNDLGAILNFDVQENEELELKVSISPISVEQAKVDMHNEIKDWNFDDAYKRADKQWNDVLGKVRVESSEKSDPTGELKKLFYTHLYHMFMTPVNATSTSGTFRGTDGKIHNAKDYTHYDSWTLWDDYRKYPMIGLVMPDTYKDMVKSIANALDYGIVTWSHDKQPVPNVRTEHAVALLADGVAKGFTDIDNLEEAYEEAKKIANKVITEEVEEIGYVPNRMDRTMEYAYDDWALSIIAEALGKEDEAQYFLDRSFNYKNMFRKDAVQSPFSDRKLGLVWNKDKDGNWSKSSPTKIGADGLYQGSMWQYTWYGSNDVNGLMDLMGGKEAMLEALQYLFGEHAPDNGNAMLHNAANEVELHSPYLFNFVGRPDKAQYWVRQIYTDETWNTGYASGAVKEKMYKLSPQGYLETMDDDAGTMAMMFVSAAMGIFPMTPGDTTFQIGSPFFERVSLDVGNGKTFTIEANNVSDENMHIQSATLNGESFNRTWVDYSEITRGGVLSFEMDNKPSEWAKDGVTAKSSSDKANTASYDDDEIAYSTGMLEESKLNDGSFDQKLEITLETNEFTGDVNEDLTALGKIKISNLPKGLKASAVKTDKNKVVVSLDGKAEGHALNDSISNLTIEITDSATKTPIINSIRKIKDNIKVMFDDDQLSYSLNEFNEGKNDDGSIIDTATITLSGNSVFTGNLNEDFVETEKVIITNLPEGLTAKVIKTGDKTVVLSFEGKAKSHDSDVEIELSFNDNAFDGAKASTIHMSSRGGMTALLLDFDYNHTANLRRTIAEAEYIRASAYSKASYQVLLDEIEKGKQLLEKEDATSKEIELAIANIVDAQEHLTIPSDGFSRLQAEKSDAWSGESLKNENGNLGGTYDGAWIRYDGLDFEGLNPLILELRYDNASDRCASDSSLEVRVDGLDGQLIGTVELPTTGKAWGTYKTIQVAMDNPEILKGKHDVYFVFRGTTGEKPYIANVDYLQFRETAVVSKVKLEAERSDTWSDGSLKNESINLGGTYDEAWIQYNNVNFDNLNANKINVRYSTRVDACALDARIEVRKDSKDGELLGTVNMPLTTGWSDYQVATVELDKPLTGVNNICFVLRGTTDSKRLYIANVDYMEFEKSGVTHIEAEDKNDWSNGELKIENIRDSNGNELTGVGGTRGNAWLRYNDVEFNGKTEATVRYSHNPSTGDNNSRMDIYLDNMDGNPVGSIELPTTGGWANYTFAKTILSEEITGKHDVYIKLHTENPSKWVANFDWFEFGQPTAETDKSKLQAKYDENKDILRDSGKYHYVGFNIFKNKILDANMILEKKDATDNDVRVAIKNIDNAIATLQYKIAFELNDSLLELKSINEADYTSDSYARFIEAIQYAESIKDGSEYDVYKGAYDGLIGARSQLTLLNRNDLNEMIKRAESIDLDQYLDEGKSEFKAALENAKKVYETVSLTQKQVDDATKSLGDSINALKKIPESVSKDELNNLIKEVESLDKSKYTEESWNVMIDALAKAKEVANNENATQEEVDEAYRNLENAKNSLVKNEDKPGDGNKPGDGDKPGEGNNNGDGSNNENNDGKPNDEGKLPNTGGNSPVVIGLLGLALSASGVAIFKKKNKIK